VTDQVAGGGVQADSPEEPMPTLRHAKRDTGWLVGVTLLVMATGMAYSILWPDLIRHHGFYWATPGDLWFTVRTTHWIGWGALSWVYSNNHSELITLPGFEILLTPFVMLGSALHLTEVAPGLPGPLKPTEWLLLGPVTLACSAVPLFAVDALARRLELARWRRRAAALVTGAALWPAIAIWGHPEDVLSLGLTVFAVVRIADRRWTAAGWLLGAALALQLLAVMAVPVLIGVLGVRRAAPFLARAAVLPGFLLVVVLVPDHRDAISVLLRQPTDPRVDHATPWMALSQHLASGLVTGGSGRFVGVAAAIALGFAGRRWRHDLWRLTWLLAAALSVRVFFESVMVPYYVMPGVVLAVLASFGTRRRWPLTTMAGAALTVVTFTRHGEWAYWGMTCGIAAAMLILSWPPSDPAMARRADPGPGSTRHDDPVPVPEGEPAAFVGSPTG